MNAIALLGTLQSEPELRKTQDGLSRMSVMLSFTAERPEDPDYQIRVVAFGNLADETFQVLHHGTGVVVEGRLQAETRQRPDGTKEKVTEVIARRIHPLAATAVAPVPAAPARPAAVPASTPAPRNSSRPAASARPVVAVDDHDDIPF